MNRIQCGKIPLGLLCLILTLIYSRHAPALDSSETMLRQANEAVMQLHSFTVEMHIRDEIVPLNRPKRIYEIKRNIRMQRPNRFAIFTTETGMPIVLCDGKKIVNLTSFNNTIMRLDEVDAPSTLDDLYKKSVKNQLTYGLLDNFNIISLFLAKDSFPEMQQQPSDTRYLGDAIINTIPAEGIYLADDKLEIEIWCNKENHLLHQIKIDYEKTYRLHPVVRGLKKKISIDFKDWKLNQDLSESDFSFTLPEADARKNQPADDTQPGKKAENLQERAEK